MRIDAVNIKYISSENVDNTEWIVGCICLTTKNKKYGIEVKICLKEPGTLAHLWVYQNEYEFLFVEPLEPITGHRLLKEVTDLTCSDSERLSFLLFELKNISNSPNFLPKSKQIAKSILESV